MKRPERATIDCFSGRHASDVLLVIGNSASLGGMVVDLFGKFVTIGVNRLLRVYKPTYLLVVDKSVIRDEHERMKAVAGEVVILAYPGTMSSKVRKSWYNGEWISTGPMSVQANPLVKRGGPIHICRNGNSGYEAAQIAYRMGASVIALAGIDMYWPPGRPSHFFGSGKDAKCSMPFPQQKIEDFGRLKAMYRRVGVEMVSVSPWNTPFRRAMEYISLEELCRINGR